MHDCNAKKEFPIDERKKKNHAKLLESEGKRSELESNNQPLETDTSTCTADIRDDYEEEEEEDEEEEYITEAKARYGPWDPSIFSSQVSAYSVLYPALPSVLYHVLCSVLCSILLC